MRELRYRRFGRANWITGAVMLLAYLLTRRLFPALDNKYAVLIALLAAIVAGAVIYAVKLKKKEKEDAEKLPPI